MVEIRAYRCMIGKVPYFGIDQDQAGRNSRIGQETSAKRRHVLAVADFRGQHVAGVLGYPA